MTEQFVKKNDLYQVKVKEEHRKQDKIVKWRMTESFPVWHVYRKIKNKDIIFTVYSEVLPPSIVCKALVRARVEYFTKF